jgi:outer membrane protein TolC
LRAQPRHEEMSATQQFRFHSFPLLLLTITLILSANPVLADATNSNPLTFDAAVNLALSQNRDLARGALAIDRSKLGVEAASQEFATGLIPRGGINTTDNNTDYRYGLRAERKLVWGTEIGIEGNVLHYPSFVDEPWRSAVRIDVRQPLFQRFGRLVHEEPLTTASEQYRAERRRWELQKSDLVVDVARQFESIVRLEKQVACDLAMFTRANQLLELTRAREQQGRVSRVDTLRVELQRGEAETRLENDRESLFVARRNLAELLGLPTETDCNPAPSLLPDLEVPAMTVAVQTALSNRLDYAQTIQDYHASVRGAKLARRRLLPDVNLVAGAEQFGKAVTMDESKSLDESLWTVGLAGQIDLAHRRDKPIIDISDVDVKAARESIGIRALSIAREVQQGVSAYRQARSELSIAGRNYAAAEARSELARRLFEMGRGDSFSVTDAETAFVNAEAALLTARASVCVAGYNLLRLMGTLMDCPAELKPTALEPTI